MKDKPQSTEMVLMIEAGVKLKEKAIITDSETYIYYEICEGKRSHLEKDYNKALNYFYTKVLFF